MLSHLLIQNKHSLPERKDDLDYFKSVNIEGTRNADSEKTYKTMMKYLNILLLSLNGEKRPLNSKDISDFIRNLYFNSGLKLQPLSRKYINNILFAIMPTLRQRSIIDENFKLDLKQLWHNMAKERKRREKNNLDIMSRRDRFEMLNPTASSKENVVFFVLSDKSATIILNECKNEMIRHDRHINIFSDTIQCYTALFLAFATGARAVANILTLTFDEMNLLINTGSVICQGKHLNRCSIYIVPAARETYLMFFRRGLYENKTRGSQLWFTIGKKKFRSWYRRLIYRLFQLPLKKGKVLHEIRTWLIGRVNDKAGLRAAAKTVSHTRLTTTSKYVDRSLGNIDAISVLEKSFQNFTF